MKIFILSPGFFRTYSQLGEITLRQFHSTIKYLNLATPLRQPTCRLGSQKYDLLRYDEFVVLIDVEPQIRQCSSQLLIRTVQEVAQGFGRHKEPKICQLTDSHF